MSADLRSIDAPGVVRRPLMEQTWRDVAFLHWRVEPATIEALLPPGLSVDTFDGSGWVGLVAFEMVGIRGPHLPAIPYLGTFPETNVRTYVRDLDGRPGVWFHSLEATRLLPVLTARAGYALPYMWARMGIQHADGSVRYESTRRWPAPRGVGGVVTVVPDPSPTTPTPLDAFMTARWGLFTTSHSGSLRYAPVEHGPWPLHRAEAPHVRDTLIEAAGYPPPEGPPHVLWSPGVDVRVGRPLRVEHA
jgi:uncharacterized protein YqjF (DUF2071 family)